MSSYYERLGLASSRIATDVILGFMSKVIKLRQSGSNHGKA